MKAPDKIYLEKFPSGSIGVVWNDNIQDCGRNEPIEYIRKYALLEWAKDIIADKEEEPDVWSSGFRFALNVLINKLNEL